MGRLTKPPIHVEVFFCLALAHFTQVYSRLHFVPCCEQTNGCQMFRIGADNRHVLAYIVREARSRQSG